VMCCANRRCRIDSAFFGVPSMFDSLEVKVLFAYFDSLGLPRLFAAT